jgi:hypothetical protein
MNAENVSEIKTWLRNAVTVFDQVTSAQSEAARIRQEVGLMEAKARQLRAEKAELEEFLTSARTESQKLMPPCPMTAGEFQGIWNQAGTHYRPFVEKLAALWGIEIKM